MDDNHTGEQALLQRAVFKVIPMLNPDGGMAARTCIGSQRIVSLFAFVGQSLTATIASPCLVWT